MVVIINVIIIRDKLIEKVLAIRIKLFKVKLVIKLNVEFSGLVKVKRKYLLMWISLLRKYLMFIEDL